MSLIIKTNNQPRSIIYGYELTEKEQAEFDYINDIESAQFFRYRGNLYDLGEFMYIDRKRESLPEGFKHWHGYQSDSFFSGLLVKYTNDDDCVIVGTYYS